MKAGAKITQCRKEGTRFTKQSVKERAPELFLGVYDAKFRKEVRAAKSIFPEGTETVPSGFLGVVWARLAADNAIFCFENRYGSAMLLEAFL